MRSIDWLAWAWLLLAAVTAGAVAAAIGGSLWWAGGAAVLAALAAGWIVTQRQRRRARLDRAPFPEAWRRVLEERVAFYRELGEPERRRFERDVRAFLAETVVTGPRGAPLDDALKVLVGASAVILVFGRPGYRYPRVRDVVVYPDAYDGESYEVRSRGDLLGEVGGQGPIILSAKALREGFADAEDGHNVGLHEFAHVLDLDGGAADGIPSLMPWRSVRPWIDLMHRETRRVEERRSILREYAATNEAELFAVATEAFFEQPRELARQHPELYATLREVYGQDPAAARGAR